MVGCFPISTKIFFSSIVFVSIKMFVLNVNIQCGNRSPARLACSSLSTHDLHCIYLLCRRLHEELDENSRKSRKFVLVFSQAVGILLLHRQNFIRLHLFVAESFLVELEGDAT